MSTDFLDRLRVEMSQVEASPRPGLVRDAYRRYRQEQKTRCRGAIAATGGAVAAVAVAAAATVLALPSSHTHPGTREPASAKPKPGKALSLVSYTFTAAAEVTAAHVLEQAARNTPDGNAPLVRGWPKAPYWYSLQQSTDSACPGAVVTSKSWINSSGNGVTDNEPANGLTCNDQAYGAFPDYNPGPAGAQVGGKFYPWAQFAALPTDPAKLWPILQADANVGVAPAKGGQAFVFDTIIALLSGDPLSPAMRKALFEVAEKVPGVTVVGSYTDSLGRTGTALRSGSQTTVVDPSNGQVLAVLNGAPPIPPGCVRASETPARATGDGDVSCTVSGASVTVFISAGPASAASVPKVSGGSPLRFASPPSAAGKQ